MELGRQKKTQHITTCQDEYLFSEADRPPLEGALSSLNSRKILWSYYRGL